MGSILKKALLMAAFILAFTCMHAQALQDVVHLKNGSRIKGVVVEQIPNVSLKIRIADGSVFVYPMSEVEKITKEPTSSQVAGSGLVRGYRGFFDFGYSIGFENSFNRLEFSTSHGYQFMPYLYAGLGIGMQYYHSLNAAEIPVYAYVRSEFLKHSVSPFLDLKIGCNVYADVGFYIAPSVGCRFAVGQKAGIGISLGYTMHNVKVSYYDASGYYNNFGLNIGGFSIKVGVDF